jgi:hypothetical protein
MDVERTIQFLLQQQARFDQVLREQQTILHEQQTISAEQHARFESEMSEIRGVLLDLANHQERTNEIVAILAERQVATEETVRGLAWQQKTTEQNLNALIAILERHIASHN